jgi:hypothetical protein
VHARVLPGKDVTIVNVSARGALVETQHRLLPGSPVELLVEGDPGRATVRGRVLRCFVSGVRSAGVSYRGAIGFDGDLRWLDDPAECRPVSPRRMPACEPRRSRPVSPGGAGL